MIDAAKTRDISDAATRSDDHIPVRRPTVLSPGTRSLHVSTRLARVDVGRHRGNAPPGRLDRREFRGGALRAAVLGLVVAIRGIRMDAARLCGIFRLRR